MGWMQVTGSDEIRVQMKKTKVWGGRWIIKNHKDSSPSFALFCSFTCYCPASAVPVDFNTVLPAMQLSSQAPCPPTFIKRMVLSTYLHFDLNCKRQNCWLMFCDISLWKTSIHAESISCFGLIYNVLELLVCLFYFQWSNYIILIITPFALQYLKISEFMSISFL